MKRQRCLITLAAMLLAVAVGVPVRAQDSSASKKENPPGGDQAQMMAMAMEMAKTNENHKMLEATVGNWSYKIKWWMAPGAPPMEMAGTAVTKSVFDGRYFTTENTGKMTMPGPDGSMTTSEFKGMATEGYDNAKKKFVSSWIDNMGTSIIMMEGAYDPASKTLTYTGEEQPLPGVKYPVRQATQYTDKDHHLLQFFETHDGKETKVMEIAYNRTQ